MQGRSPPPEILENLPSAFASELNAPTTASIECASSDTIFIRLHDFLLPDSRDEKQKEPTLSDEVDST